MYKVGPIIVLSLIGLLCFGPILRKIGFYLDDWATVAYLHFAPHDSGPLGLLKYYLFNDPRVMGRPLEVIHYGLIYWFSGAKPFAFHLVNLILEGVAAALVYLIFLRFSGAASLSFIAALFFLLHPGHDSTHYWVICSSVTLSMCFYLGALLCSTEACAVDAGSKRRRLILLGSSAFLYFLSLINYEVLLPLAAVNVLAVFFMKSENGGRVASALRLSLILAIPVLLLLFYLKVCLPLIGPGYVHGAVFDIGFMSKTILLGLNLNTPWVLINFAVEQARQGLEGIRFADWLRLAGVALLAGAAVVVLAVKTRAKSESRLDGKDNILIGLIGLVAAYSIFGLSADYEPTFYTMVNRVNSGGAFCASLILLGALQCLEQPLKGRRRLSSVLLVALSATMAVLFTAADWGLAKPWIASWSTQQVVRENLVAQASKIPPGSTLLLLNCPRYVMWSPVFDGVWDFGNMMRIAFNDSGLQANVVSERLGLSEEGVEDRSRGFRCGAYAFDKLFLVVAPKAELVRVRGAADFVDVVSRRGMTFGLAPEALKKWQQQAADLVKH